MGCCLNRYFSYTKKLQCIWQKDKTFTLNRQKVFICFEAQKELRFSWGFCFINESDLKDLGKRVACTDKRNKSNEQGYPRSSAICREVGWYSWPSGFPSSSLFVRQQFLVLNFLMAWHNKSTLIGCRNQACYWSSRHNLWEYRIKINHWSITTFWSHRIDNKKGSNK